MRQVHISENLTGQTLTGPAQESLFWNCILPAALSGDWSGSDFLSSTGACDFRQADIKGAYFRGNTLNGSLFPEMGWLQYEPLVEIVRPRLATLSVARRQRVIALGQRLLSRHAWNAWDETVADWWTGQTAATRTAIINFIQTTFAGHPRILGRFARLRQQILSGDLITDDDITLCDVFWPGTDIQFTINTSALPVLPDPSRYTLARWIEQEALSRFTGNLDDIRRQFDTGDPVFQCRVETIRPLQVSFGYNLYPVEEAY